jgi:hypothetical protein
MKWHSLNCQNSTKKNISSSNIILFAYMTAKTSDIWIYDRWILNVPQKQDHKVYNTMDQNKKDWTNYVRA